LAAYSLLKEAENEQAAPLHKRAWAFFYPTVDYLFTIESHVYAMAIAASVLLGFFPFMVLILSLSQNVFGWTGAVEAIFVGLRDVLPNDPGLVEFVERNLRAAVDSRGHAELISIPLLLYSSNGIFMPLEVAFNRMWGFPRHRSYWRNQLMSFCLTLACGVLALTAAVLTSANTTAIFPLLERFSPLRGTVMLVLLKMAAIPFSVVIFLLVFWMLPNGHVRVREVAPTAIGLAIMIELAKNLYVWTWPLLGFRRAYGPFFISVTLLVWGFFAAMLVLGGAEICVRRAKGKPTASLTG
jgi:YihY family inner membrane protein